MFKTFEKEAEMNATEFVILNEIIENGYKSQRDLKLRIEISLGSINGALKKLKELDFLDESCSPTKKAMNLAKKTKPKNAVILAAGYGMRMIPINMDIPKGLLEVDGIPLIERLIEQLREKGIFEIYVIVGFLKEKYEYLIDKFDVQLVTNSDYSQKNNLHSLSKAINYLDNTYVIPCDVWCKNNPFRRNELLSWYMVSDEYTTESTFRVNKKYELVRTKKNEMGNDDIGIAYISKNDTAWIKERITELCADFRYDGIFWESALEDGGKYRIIARVEKSYEVKEINTYIQLEELNHHFNQLSDEASEWFRHELGVSEIEKVSILKNGITNHTFLVTCQKGDYTVRIPNREKHPLIHRSVECEVYKAISESIICEHPIAFDEKSGYKISKYHAHASVCDMKNEEHVKKCLQTLKTFHIENRKKGIRVSLSEELDIVRQLDVLENLFLDGKSVYRDYRETKKSVLRALSNIEKQEKVLSCVDCTPDNFLILEDGSVEIIDMENASMQDPKMDFAMFCVNGRMKTEEIEKWIDFYFEDGYEDRKDIYAYIAVAGLFWSNWCEYNFRQGVDFGEYSLLQYRYAKEYSRKALEE